MISFKLGIVRLGIYLLILNEYIMAYILRS